jgi:hypothetical protein
MNLLLVFLQVMGANYSPSIGGGFLELNFLKAFTFKQVGLRRTGISCPA